MAMMGQRGRYLDIKWAERPVVVNTMMACTCVLSDASTAEMATAVEVSHGVGVLRLSSMKILYGSIGNIRHVGKKDSCRVTLVKRAASASSATECIMDTVSSG